MRKAIEDKIQKVTAARHEAVPEMSELGERVVRAEERVAALLAQGRAEDFDEVGAEVRGVHAELADRLRTAEKRVEELGELDKRLGRAATTIRTFHAGVHSELADHLRSSLPPAGNLVYVVDPFRKVTYTCGSSADALLPLREMWRLYPEAFREVKYSRHDVAGLGEVCDRPAHLRNCYWLGSSSTAATESVFCVAADPASPRQPLLKCGVTGNRLTAGFGIVYVVQTPSAAAGAAAGDSDDSGDTVDACDTYGTLPDDSAVMFGSVATYRDSFTGDSKFEGQTFCSTQFCAVCGKTAGIKKCSGCKYAWYCGTECQLVDWAVHKRRCTRTLLRRGTLKEFPATSCDCVTV